LKYLLCRSAIFVIVKDNGRPVDLNSSNGFAISHLPPPEIVADLSQKSPRAGVPTIFHRPFRPSGVSSVILYPEGQISTFPYSNGSLTVFPPISHEITNFGRQKFAYSDKYILLGKCLSMANPSRKINDLEQQFTMLSNP
jgi:hypothetical protein